MYVIVIGGGKVGYYLTKELLAAGHEIVLLEKDPRRARQIADEVGSIVLARDGCEGKHLAEAGANRAAIVAAVTGDDEDNLVVCQMAKHHFDVPRTIARVNNPKNEELFRHLGVDDIISPTRMILGAVEQDIPVHELLHLAQLEGGELEVMEAQIALGLAGRRSAAGGHRPARRLHHVRGHPRRGRPGHPAGDRLPGRRQGHRHHPHRVPGRPAPRADRGAPRSKPAEPSADFRAGARSRGENPVTNLTMALSRFYGLCAYSPASRWRRRFQPGGADHEHRPQDIAIRRDALAAPGDGPPLRGVDRPSAQPRLRVDGGPLAPARHPRHADALVVEAALPGVKPEDVEITVTGDTLTISGCSSAESEREERGYLLREIRRGRFSRTVTLPADLRTEAATAGFENGLLRLSIPKAEAAKPRQIRITPTTESGASAETETSEAIDVRAARRHRRRRRPLERARACATGSDGILADRSTSSAWPPASSTSIRERCASTRMRASSARRARRTNIRLYSENDIRRVLWIRHLTQNLGVNLAGVRDPLRDRGAPGHAHPGDALHGDRVVPCGRRGRRGRQAEVDRPRTLATPSRRA